MNNEYIDLGIEIYHIVKKLEMPRAVVHDFPSTLDKDSDLYHKREKFAGYFGDNLKEISYIPICSELELLFKDGEVVALSNLLLGECLLKWE